ncbi:Cj0069 family protein [Bradyrhizobium viridifuturi]|uniref:Cj0069 family protein n=1 Tax=Bradyrhizobium viridifuturi TaxID=1654716 RepID=UPI00067F096D|nr:Cj0069 family protein [Bradyrhizobium viridifuturi]
MDSERQPSSRRTVAILSRGDAVVRRDATSKSGRFVDVFEALAAVGVEGRPAIYDESFANAVREELLAVDGVLVWVNPIQDGRNRADLDALLRDVAAQGVWVSTHPDVILKMGTKEVLYRTRSMGWGSDTALYQTAAVMRAELPVRLAAGPRVIKRNHGNGGRGVWKVEKLPDSSRIKVLDATKDAPEELTLDDFLHRCAEYFENGSVIDQAFQPRLSEGVVRCYMAGDRCAGFGYHKVKALVEPPSARAGAGPRLYTSNADPRFQRLRRLMEDEWTPQLTSLLDIARDDLPAIWDADFMLGPVQADGSDSYVLGEINVSSVHPYPSEAPTEIARRVADRLQLKL